MKIQIKAPAKINLYLEIISRRPNGYHNIESIFHTVDLFDMLNVEESKDIQLSCSNSALPVDQSNLIYKTIVKMQNYFNVNKAAKIHLIKNIPMGAGLGGGSSDAAATIKALNRIWNLNKTKKELEQFATLIGADVPFFLTGGTALVEGIGEKITKINIKSKYNFVLAKPNFGVSTVWAYSQVKLPLTNINKIDSISKVLSKNILTTSVARRLFFNRFEEFVFPRYREIEDIKKYLESFGCATLMSGSGATIFALASSKEQSVDLVKKLNQQGWNAWAVSSFEVQDDAEVENGNNGSQGFSQEGRQTEGLCRNYL